MATNVHTLDDESLMRLIVQAQPEALSELYDRYGRLVFSLAINAVGDAATAEEVTQDVFLRVWERAWQYRADQAKVSTWLTSIARHRAIDQLRRQGVRPEWQSIGWADVSPQAEPSTDGPEQSAEIAIQRRARSLAGEGGRHGEGVALQGVRHAPWRRAGSASAPQVQAGAVHRGR